MAAGVASLLLSLAMQPAGVLAQDSAPTVVADKETYYNGEYATVTVTNLTSCAGQEIELGFGFQTDSTVDKSPLVTIGADGSASVSILMETGVFELGHSFAIARGTCVPDGELRATERVTVLNASGPPGSTPVAPDTGTGTRPGNDSGASSVPAAAAGLLVISAGAAVVAAVRGRMAARSHQ